MKKYKKDCINIIKRSKRKKLQLNLNDILKTNNQSKKGEGEKKTSLSKHTSKEMRKK